MRPRSHHPLSLTAIKRAPSSAMRIPENPPKCRKPERNTNPPRKSNGPNCRREGLKISKEAIGWDATAIATGDSAARDNSLAAKKIAPARQRIDLHQER